MSGRPISFVQDLYQPLYIPRPVVQPELYASLNPQTYEGGMSRPKAESADADGEGDESDAVWRRKRWHRRRLRRAAGELAFGDGWWRRLVAAGGSARGKPMDAAASVASVASAGKIGELFQYTVSQPVTLASPEIRDDPDHHRRRRM